MPFLDFFSKISIKGLGSDIRLGRNESEVPSNRGNIKELMNMLGCYSPELRSFLNNDHVTYSSHEPQNDTIECVFKEVRQEVQNRIDHSGFIGVMMDDTSDFFHLFGICTPVTIIMQP